MDQDWIKLYIHFNRELCCDLKGIEPLLPTRRKDRRGIEAGIGYLEAKEREIRGNEKNSNWTWPQIKASKKEIRKMVAIALEIVVKFFFSNFLYTFGGELYQQSFGGPIRSRLTMAFSRLAMQAWYEKYRDI